MDHRSRLTRREGERVSGLGAWPNLCMRSLLPGRVGLSVSLSGCLCPISDAA